MKGGRNVFTGIVTLLAFGLVAFFCYTGDYVYALFALPVFLLDFCIAEAYRQDTMVNIFKAFLLCQGLGLWYLNSKHFFDVPASDIQKALKFHQQFDWNNASALIRDIGQHTVSSWTAMNAPGPEHVAQPIDPLKTFPVRVLASESQYIHPLSQNLVNSTFGCLPATDFPDLRYYSKEEIQGRHPTIFLELPGEGFEKKFKNPCWYDGARKSLECLPYAYVLGQPKSGTSDLFERMQEHSDIIMPNRKEVRWFTRGEFSRTQLHYEGNSGHDEESVEDGPDEWEPQQHGQRSEKLLGSKSSVYTFTRAFKRFASELSVHGDIESVAESLITVDGGPHTLWWPTQSPDGKFLLDIPPAQLLREMQPDAKFIITLNDPVRRMYSDYYFLHDNLKPLRPGMLHNKSGEEFHLRTVQQLQLFDSCIQQYMTKMRGHGVRGGAFNMLGAKKIPQVGEETFPLWFRASQMCAHDRHRFAVGGWGRLSVSLYVLFIEKWLEQFPPDQFLVVRLEDYEKNPKQYMSSVFNFLGLAQPDDWTDILRDVHFNSHKVDRDPIWIETEQLLRTFFKPYNELLAQALDSDKFLWNDSTKSLHDALVEERDSAALQLLDHPKKKHRHTNSNDHKTFLHRSHNSKLNHVHDNYGDMKTVSNGDSIVDSERLMDETQRAEAMHRLRNEARGVPLKVGNLRSSTPLINRLASSDIAQNEKLVLNPRSFSLDGLVMFNSEKRNFSNSNFTADLSSRASAGTSLCNAAFLLDISALYQILYEHGVSGDVVAREEAGRNALHCLGLIYTLADSSPKSHVFSLLKGSPSWLNDHFEPALELKLASVLSRDIVSRLERDIVAVARWLLRAGVPVNGVDAGGWTPLHFASMGGVTAFVNLLLESGANPNLVNKRARTPLHMAAVLGHAEVAASLIEHGADVNLQDEFGVKAIDVLSNPGPISPEDALLFLNITQRPAKHIDRLLHPEDHPEDLKRGWPGGYGGWSSDRMKGFEDTLSCEGIDQYWSDEITEEIVFHQYLARNSPVLIRGLLNNWTTIETYKQQNLLADHNELRVQVSDIPYSEKFGSSRHVDKTLGEYIQEIIEHRMEGGTHPWYVFKGNTIPRMSDSPESLVRIEDCPTPSVVQGAFEQCATVALKGKSDPVEARKVFVNAQWALGGIGTGAPAHYHNTAWSSLVYGAKYWMIYPPHNQIMSNMQTLEYLETDMLRFKERNVKPVTCVQTAGDVLIIPESWGHAVLNIQESVTMATESKTALFRLSPGTKLFTHFPAAPPREHDREYQREHRHQPRLFGRNP